MAKDKLTAELLPRGTEKHYGTQIQLKNGDWNLGNPLKVWYCGDSWGDDLGEDRPELSEREIEDENSHWVGGGHYESKADLEIAKMIVARINAHDRLVEFVQTVVESGTLGAEGHEHEKIINRALELLEEIR